MTKLEQAARQALEALETQRIHSDANWDTVYKAVTALREALAEPGIEEMTLTQIAARHEQAEQEPVAYVYEKDVAGIGMRKDVAFTKHVEVGTDLYAAPVQQAEQEPFDMNDHPPHRLCECRKCMEYFTPLPDCDAFAASGKQIAEQTNTQFMEGFRPVSEMIAEHKQDPKKAAAIEKAKIRKAEQEPVAVMDVFSGWSDVADVEILYHAAKKLPDGEYKLYAAPVRTKDLTDDEIVSVLDYYDHEWDETTFAIARAVIAKDREKNK